MKRELVTDPLAFESGDQIEGVSRWTDKPYRATLVYYGACKTSRHKGACWHWINSRGTKLCSVSNESIRAGRVYRIRRPPEGLTLVRRPAKQELVR